MADQESAKVVEEQEQVPAAGSPPEGADPHATLRAQSQDDLIKVIEDLRKSEAKMRNRAKSADDRVAAIEAKLTSEAEERRKAELTEVERLKEELKAAQEAHTQIIANLEAEKVNRGIIASLTAKGYKFHREDEILQFADRSMVAKDSTGNLSGFDDIAEKLYTERPHFFDRGVRSPAVPGGGPEPAAKVKPTIQEIQALSIKDPKAAKQMLKEHYNF